MSIFHGDIKPPNVLTPLKISLEERLFADIDTLLLLDGPQDETVPFYLSTSFSMGFSSGKYISCVKKGTR